MMFTHSKSVRKEKKDNWVTEYDEYNRVTFHKDSNDFWSLKFYDDPLPGKKPSFMPYMVVHKYWHMYNDL